MSEELHANFMSAKAMVEQSMGSPSKTVKYLPVFMRVFPQKNVQLFRESNEKSLLSSLRHKYCVQACDNPNQKDKCLDQCKQFYNKTISGGLDVIRKVHKQYKLQALEQDDQ